MTKGEEILKARKARAKVLEEKGAANRAKGRKAVGQVLKLSFRRRRR